MMNCPAPAPSGVGSGEGGEMMGEVFSGCAVRAVAQGWTPGRQQEGDDAMALGGLMAENTPTSWRRRFLPSDGKHQDERLPRSSFRERHRRWLRIMSR